MFIRRKSLLKNFPHFSEIIVCRVYFGLNSPFWLAGLPGLFYFEETYTFSINIDS